MYKCPVLKTEIYHIFLLKKKKKNGAKSRKGENGNMSAHRQPIKKIKPLSFLQLLKLKNRKCLYYFYLEPQG